MKPQIKSALLQAQTVLRNLTFKDDAITSALESIHRALDDEERIPVQEFKEGSDQHRLVLGNDVSPWVDFEQPAFLYEYVGSTEFHFDPPRVLHFQDFIKQTSSV